MFLLLILRDALELGSGNAGHGHEIIGSRGISLFFGVASEATKDRHFSCCCWSHSGSVVFHTYKVRPTGNVWTPLDGGGLIEQNFTTNGKNTNNCQTFEDLGRADVHERLLASCLIEQKALKEGGYYARGSSAPLYLALNAAVAVAAFAVIFGLTHLLPALARRYWRWLNT
jgi:hypothetical protein